jgi:hypothetical protein
VDLAAPHGTDGGDPHDPTVEVLLARDGYGEDGVVVVVARDVVSLSAMGETGDRQSSRDHAQWRNGPQSVLHGLCPLNERSVG